MKLYFSIIETQMSIMCNSPSIYIFVLFPHDLGYSWLGSWIMYVETTRSQSYTKKTAGNGGTPRGGETVFPKEEQTNGQP